MKLRAIFLLLLIGFDLSLHWFEILGKVALHPLYPTFPLWGFLSYNIFWVSYWSVGFLNMLTLLGSGTTVKNKTTNITHVHNELPKVKKESGGETPADLKIKEVQDETIPRTN